MHSKIKPNNAVREFSPLPDQQNGELVEEVDGEEDHGEGEGVAGRGYDGGEDKEDDHCVAAVFFQEGLWVSDYQAFVDRMPHL